jgi:hypothetical protein
MGKFRFSGIDTSRLWLEGFCLWNRLVIPWHNAVWAQKVQFQDLLFSLRNNPIHGALDPKRLKTVTDFQRLVPVPASPPSPLSSFTNIAHRPSSPQRRGLQNELYVRLLEGYRLASKIGDSLKAAALDGVLVLDTPPFVDLQKPETTGPWTEIQPNPRIRLDLVSQIPKVPPTNPRISNWKTLFDKKDYRCIIGTQRFLREWGKTLGFADESWPWHQFSRLEAVVTDSPEPANKPTSLSWMEIKTALGNVWAHISRNPGLAHGWPRAGLFWEFIEPGSPLTRGNNERFWLGNVPLNIPFELVISSTKGLIAQRTGICLLLKDRNKAIFQIAQRPTSFQNQNVREAQTNPLAPHQPKSDREEGWQGISPHIPW